MNTLGGFHTICALLALASGAAVLLRKKGTRGHRRLGWVYVCSMVALNVSALMIYRLFGGFGPFHVGAIFSLVSVVAGAIPAIRRRPAHWMELHYAWMAWSYVGLCAAAVSEVGTRTPGLQFWWGVMIGTAGVFGAGAVLIRRNQAAVLAPFRRRARPAAPAAD